ncbi:UDP-N-acetylmuramate--L-alanine ligase [Thermus thermamylovorans]|uniref:UDP-N-acetylmuramate--L-alanine ligase n=1 Tax=Thermus thermamylovorans TaxID=2509362 RepID=A0A4V2IVA6_9DEIN|nr:Mur ligase domain-containing protein [Thermus thermamylovorans]TBH21575.1 UDP-N-acetylmuramate--L-alanine ligase [Thermus thermamylovorans]
MKRAHLMGIEGVGMSALARLLLAEGVEVTGCDLAPGGRARALGVPVLRGHDPAHLEGADTLVVPTPIPPDHPEAAEAQRRGLRVVRRMELLAHLLEGRPSLGVTGTHGKTTTTGMLASVLLAAGLDPWVFLGGDLSLLPGNARPGRGPRLAEVDESDPLFQGVRVRVAVATNLEADHVAPRGRRAPNYHGSLEELQAAMRGFLLGAEVAVVPASDPLLLEASRGLPRRLFGEGGEVWAEGVELGPWGSRFLLIHRGRPLGEARLQVPGAHNVQNALAAALGALAFGVEEGAILEGLARFPGVGRRFQRVGEVREALVVDDYAHHPTEVRATLEAARLLGRRVRVLFQPHRLLRTQELWEAFAQALAPAEEVVVLPVYTAGERGEVSPEGLAQRIAERLLALGTEARFLENEEALAYARATAAPGDLWLALGAGDVTELARRLVHEG